MKRKWVLTALLLAHAWALASGAMVTERWGVGGRVQHPSTLRYEPIAKQGTLLAFDLSALPAPTMVYSARLFFSGANWKESGFDVVPAAKTEGDPKATGKPLAVAGPAYQWLDATEAVRGWAAAGQKAGLLWMRNARALRQDATILEIAFEGEPRPPDVPQASGVKAVARPGQVFITFREGKPLDEGNEPVNWGDLAKKLKGDYYGPVPGGPLEGITYGVYGSDKPITAANIGQAHLLGEVLPGSAFNTRIALKIDEKRKTEDLANIEGGRGGEGMATGPSVLALRLPIDAGAPLPPGTGLFVHTAAGGADRYYAVLSSFNGLTNTKDISEANAVGPVRPLPGNPEPILYREIITPVGKAKHVTQWYSYWAEQPLSPWPARYDLVVSFCPDLLEKPAALILSRTGWNCWPTPAGPRPTAALAMSHAGDMPVDFRTGLHDSIGTLKGFDQGRWQPFHTNRQAALVRWMAGRWAVDPNRISVEIGAWGMMEIKQAALYAMIRGWGEPELTKGFQCWDRARGIWGVPELYKGRSDDENPYVAANLTDWVLANPTRELPFFFIHAGGGAHYTEEGWPPFPRFCWAMMKAKQPFLFATARDSAVADAISTGRLVIRRDQSLPAFAHCSLDDNLGEGDLHSGNGWDQSQVNGWILWDPSTIVDEPSRWEITLWVGERCPLPEGIVDLTPRRCQKFAARPRQALQWTNAALPPSDRKPDEKGRPEPPNVDGAKVIQQGTAEADGHGFVTLSQLRITQGRHRIAITPAR